MGLLDLGNETTVLYVEQDAVAKSWLKNSSLILPPLLFFATFAAFLGALSG